MVVMNFWQDKKVLVTGATGLLGSEMVKELCMNEADPVIVYRDKVSHTRVMSDPNIQGFGVVMGDITNQPLMERAIGENEIEVVFHLAAQTLVGVANNNPISTFDSNIKGTWTVLEACRRSPSVKSVVVASSDKAYGYCQTLPYTEEMPLQGMYPYDVSKSCADLISQSYAETYKLPVAITRCANFYGPGDMNWNRLVPGTIRSIIRNKPIIIRSDGKTKRDYLYIEDAAEGYLMLAQHLAENPNEFRGEAFNLSTETPLTTTEMVEKIRDIMKSEVPVEIQNRATNEIPEQWLSSDKALHQLGWYCNHSLEDGLEKTIDWYRSHFT
jgi:CDP-glucose 4,6-dehydratase